MRHDKSALLLSLARSLAASAEGMTLDEMGAEIGAGRRTVERMRDALWQLFPQMEELSDPPTKRFRIPDGLDGLFQSPTADELVELRKAAASLRAGGSLDRADALFSLEKKLRAAMRSRARQRLAPDLDALARAEMIAVIAGPRPSEDRAMIECIREAIMALRALQFSYRGGTRPGAVRSVTPYGVMFSRFNYLVGLERGSDVIRNYRLDRIEGLWMTDEVAAAPAEFSLEDYAAQAFGVFQGPTSDVTLRVLPGAAEDALRWRFHPSQRVEQQADGSVLVHFRAAGHLEMAWHLFTWRDQVEILAPPELRDTMISELRSALERHQGDRRSDGVPLSVSD